MTPPQTLNAHTSSEKERLPSLLESIRASLSLLSFWSAIALPVLYLPLIATGIDSTTDFGVFFGLFGLHLLTLLGGHRSHHQST